MRQNPSVHIAYPFNIPYQIEILPLTLSIVLTEMLQYPVVGLFQEHKEGATEVPDTPIVVGTDWGSCALIMPPHGRYG